MFNILVKQTVKYLGIQITKDVELRQQLNFLPKVKKNKQTNKKQKKQFKQFKNKSILNMWLQRDLSIFGRVLLSKAEGVSRFVYPGCRFFLPMHFVKKSIICLLTLFGKIDTTILRKKFLV